MAFDIQNLTPHDAASKGSKFWTYSTSADNKATVKGDGYFDSAWIHFQTGDTIRITASDAVFDAQITVTAATEDVALAALDAFV